MCQILKWGQGKVLFLIVSVTLFTENRGHFPDTTFSRTEIIGIRRLNTFRLLLCMRGLCYKAHGEQNKLSCMLWKTIRALCSLENSIV